MYGSGNVSTTQHSTEITPNTSNIYQVSKNNNIHQSTWGTFKAAFLFLNMSNMNCSVLLMLIAPAVWCPYQPSIYILLITSKFRLPALASFMLFLMVLSSSLDNGGRQLQNTSCWRGVSGGVEGASLGIQSLPYTVQSPYSLHSILSAYRKGQLTAA